MEEVKKREVAVIGPVVMEEGLKDPAERVPAMVTLEEKVASFATERPPVRVAGPASVTVSEGVRRMPMVAVSRTVREGVVMAASETRPAIAWMAPATSSDPRSVVGPAKVAGPATVRVLAVRTPVAREERVREEGMDAGAGCKLT